MLYDPDDPRLTAYALGELDPSDRDEFEALVRDDPEARAFVADVRDTARLLSDQLHQEPSLKLSPAHHQAIEGGIRTNPDAKVPARKSSLRWVPWAIAAGLVGITTALLMPSLLRSHKPMQVAMETAPSRPVASSTLPDSEFERTEAISADTEMPVEAKPSEAKHRFFSGGNGASVIARQDLDELSSPIPIAAKDSKPMGGAGGGGSPANAPAKPDSFSNHYGYYLPQQAAVGGKPASGPSPPATPSSATASLGSVSYFSNNNPRVTTFNGAPARVTSTTTPRGDRQSKEDVSGLAIGDGTIIEHHKNIKRESRDAAPATVSSPMPAPAAAPALSRQSDLAMLPPAGAAQALGRAEVLAREDSKLSERTERERLRERVRKNRITSDRVSQQDEDVAALRDVQKQLKTEKDPERRKALEEGRRELSAKGTVDPLPALRDR